MLFLRGLKLRLPCVGVVGIFDLQFVAGIVEVVKKKQRDSKFLACTLGTCKSSHYKKQVVVYGIWGCIFNKKFNFCLRFREIPYKLYFTKLPSNEVVHAWVEYRSLCFEGTEMIFCLFWTIFGFFWTLQNCFNSASFRIDVASILFGMIICCHFWWVLDTFQNCFNSAQALSLKYLRSCNLNAGRFGV